jgi:hypothetical protein
MGVIPYNLRQRNHNFSLDQKLVDMLFLFKPDLTIIDGIVGGQGNCPAPVEPVDSRVIVSGNNVVETDRVATRLMGFDPGIINLFHIADEMGFGDSRVEIIGEQTVCPYKPANPSLTDDAFPALFPNVQVLIGHHKSHAPKYSCLEECPCNVVGEMERVCRGGCLATTRFGFDMLRYEGARRDFALTVIIGGGTFIDGKCYYFDREGKAYSIPEIALMRTKKLAVGSCTKDLKPVVDLHVDGCMPFPNSPHMALHRLTGHLCRVLTPKNRHLIATLLATLQTCENRKRQIRAGYRLDVARKFDDTINEPRSLSADEQRLDHLRWDFPPLTKEEICALTSAENWAVLAAFYGG